MSKPRPPSPTPSNASVASSTMSVVTVGGTKKKVKKGRPGSPTASVVSRFDGPEVTFEEAQLYVQQPHLSWDSALREMARRQAQGIKDDDDTRSNASTVSAYSIASSTASKASIASSAASTQSRRGRLGSLPQRTGGDKKAQPPVEPELDFSVGGQGISGSSSTRGYSFTPVGRKSDASGGPGEGRSAANGGPRTPQATKSAGPSLQRGDGSKAKLAVGAPSGPSGIRKGLPSSAPQSKGRGGADKAPPKLELMAPVASTAFVPKLAPKRK